MMYRKVAIVTGSTSGIGFGIAQALAHAGFDVMMNGFGDADEIESMRSGLEQSSGTSIRYHGADMSKPEDIEQLVLATQRQFDKVDVVVANAGIQVVAPVEEFPVEQWDLIFQINLFSAFHLTRLVFAQMKRRRWGRIINLASAHGLVASPFKSAYVAAKHGMVGFTKSIALEGAEFGITCNAICPGYVLTPLVEKQIPDTAKTRGLSEEMVKREVLLAAQPTKEFVSIDQLGALAVFLTTDAAAQINGAALPVDGGWTAQ